MPITNDIGSIGGGGVVDPGDLLVSRIVVLTGGGLKGSIAAVRNAADHDLILLHVDYGQPSAQSEFKAIEELVDYLPSARAIGLDLSQEPRVAGKETRAANKRPYRGPWNEGPVGSPVAAAQGLMSVLVSAGAQWALRMGASTIVLGLSRFCNAEHLGLTGEGVPGVGRREFVHSFNLMLESLPTAGPAIHVEAPLMDLRLSEMVKLAKRLGVPLERTWTCERSGTRPCGRCALCKARASAFVEAAVVDPLYEEKVTLA